MLEDHQPSWTGLFEIKQNTVARELKPVTRLKFWTGLPNYQVAEKILHVRNEIASQFESAASRDGVRGSRHISFTCIGRLKIAYAQ